VGLGCSFFEGVEIDDDHVNGSDSVSGYGGLVLGIAALVDQTAMNLGVQRFHAAIEHFRKAGEIANVLYLQTGLTKNARGTAGRYQLHAETGERLGERDKAGFVSDAEQCAPNALQSAGVLSHSSPQCACLPRRHRAYAGALGRTCQIPEYIVGAGCLLPTPARNADGISGAGDGQQQNKKML